MRPIPMAVVLSLALAGCTADNPRACGPGDPCRDPAFPFCDINGAVAGLPGDCLAVTCTPDAFIACDADSEIRCDSSGANYDTVVCERGCDPASDGCRLCDPNETACTNGTVATCDASGAVVSSMHCPLGCFESEPRCRQVDPSNGLASYLDAAAQANDVVLPDDTLVDTINGTVIPPGQGPLPVASFLVGAPTDGVPVRVYVVKSLHAGRLRFGDPATQAAPPALAIVAAEDVVFDGDIDLTQNRIAIGSLISGPCVGAAGAYVLEPNNRTYVTGSGGGGYRTPGAAGGFIDPLGTPPGAGLPGEAFANDDLVPLRGGCAGGIAFSNGGGGGGGGALQVVSGTLIEVNGSINANGIVGSPGEQQDGTGGGGSGGAVLLEAPRITLGSAVRLLANGGGGVSGDFNTQATASLDDQQGMDSACATPTPICGFGGAGAAAALPPHSGQTLAYSNATNVFEVTGGGGGSVGYIRLNTIDGTYTKASDVVESPATITGTIGTR